MSVNDYLRENFTVDEKMLDIYTKYGINMSDAPVNRRPRIVCLDGFSFSVQADAGMYCTPRMTLQPENWGLGYTNVEVGYPSEIEPLLLEYAEDITNPTETVYGFVPVNIVDAVIEKHGGMVLDHEIESKVEIEELFRVDKECG